MAKSDVERDFPALVGKDYDLSEEDFNNNWWEPPRTREQYWPPGFPEDLTVDTVEAIRVHGFTVEVSRGASPETDAIAIYAIGNEWTHFARFTRGVWTSKLGEGHDVSRVNLEDLTIDMYGVVVKVLSRPGR
jgi:hypothetical protein